MWNDPVVEEVHGAREQLLARAKGDLRKVIVSAARRQKAQGRVVIEAAPRTPSVTSKIKGRRKSQAL